MSNTTDLNLYTSLKNQNIMVCLKKERKVVINAFKKCFSVSAFEKRTKIMYFYLISKTATTLFLLVRENDTRYLYTKMPLPQSIFPYDNATDFHNSIFSVASEWQPHCWVRSKTVLFQLTDFHGSYQSRQMVHWPNFRWFNTTASNQTWYILILNQFPL